MEAREVSGEIFNVGSSERVRILDLARRVLELTGSRSKLVFVPHSEVYGLGIEDVLHREPSIEKIGAAIGWRPSLDLDRILADVIEHTRRAPAVERRLSRVGARRSSPEEPASSARTSRMLFLARGDDVLVVDDLSTGRARERARARRLRASWTSPTRDALEDAFDGRRGPRVPPRRAGERHRLGRGSRRSTAASNVARDAERLRGGAHARRAGDLRVDRRRALRRRARRVRRRRTSRRSRSRRTARRSSRARRTCRRGRASTARRTSCCGSETSTARGRARTARPASSRSSAAGSCARRARRSCAASGKPTRDYVHVHDVARAFVAAAEAGRAGTYNVGTGPRDVDGARARDPPGRGRDRDRAEARGAQVGRARGERARLERGSSRSSAGARRSTSRTGSRQTLDWYSTAVADIVAVNARVSNACRFAKGH